MPTGIPGFDDLLGGGLPRERTTLVLGGPGCGKTLFALETLVHGARRWREPGIFVGFEERAAQVVANASSLGWDLAALRGRKLFFLDARLPETVIQGGEFDLLGLLASVGAKVREMGARRIVFDGIDVLLGALGNRFAEQREMFRLGAWLAQHRLSGLVTCKTGPSGDIPREAESYLPYLADCVVLLQQEPRASVLLRRLRITKCRGIRHAGSEVPFTIAPTGLQVASYPASDNAHHAFTEKVSTGVERLDTMMTGGYFRGASVLISGAPGTAKSTLAAAFARAAAARGEQTLYVSFDEAPSEVIRNMRSVGINLAPLVAGGTLQIVPARKGDRSAEDHVAWLSAVIRAHGTRCVVIDPVSALMSSGGTSVGEEAAARLTAIAKSTGVTMLSTTLLEQGDPQREATVAAVSTIADTWIHVSYAVRGGERNRALTIVKSRGVGHSNQVRELVLSNRGVELADVYLAGGEVLMGTLRWQKEIEEENRRAEGSRHVARSQREAELAIAETRARLALLQHELSVRELAATAIGSEARSAVARHDRREDGLRRLRGADVNGARNGRREVGSRGMD